MMSSQLQRISTKRWKNLRARQTSNSLLSKIHSTLFVHTLSNTSIHRFRKTKVDKTNFFKKIFWRTHVHFWGHWYSCFGLLVMFPLDFKARVGSLIHTWWRHKWYTLAEIHFRCNTFAGVYIQHGNQSLSPHACFSSGRLLDSNGKPPA